MRLSLASHPDSPGAPISRIDVDVNRPSPGQVCFRYEATGQIGDIVLPPPARGERRDELWKHTCFEAFLRTPGEEGYLEFNFSPATDWAAYAFDGYRRGMRPLLEIGAPAIAVDRGAGRLMVQATLQLAMAAPSAPLELALSAVIEHGDGAKSYWALRHPPGKPDFHHPDSFAIELPAAESA